eukprot:SAG22_NODE_2956_length_2078_cov_1.551794_1_plen_54_part_00
MLDLLQGRIDQGALNSSGGMSKIFRELTMYGDSEGSALSLECLREGLAKHHLI